MAYSLSPLLKPRFFVNATNKPLVGGKLYTYLAETTTPATTYSNDTGTANANPIILDANGECNLYLDDDVSYRLILKDANDVTYFDKDRVSSIGGGDYKVLTFNTIDDLRLKIGSAKEPTAQTSGYYNAGDGGGNRFYWDGTSSAVDNGGTVIKPTFVSGAGRWLATNPELTTLKQWGCVGDGTDTDDSTKINEYLTYMAANDYKATGVGTYRIDNKITIKGDADFSQLNLNVYSNPSVAVEISTGGATNPTTALSNKNIILPKTIVNMAKSGTGWAGLGVGVRAVGCYSCNITTQNIRNFAVGFLVTSYGLTGNVYNTYNIGYLENNKVNLSLTPVDGTSWVNENLFVNGRFSHYSNEGTNVTGVRQIYLAKSTNVVNNNVFIKPSLEGNAPEYHIECGGSYNQFNQARWEAATPKILYTGDNINQGARNIIDGGYNSQNIVYTYTGTTGTSNRSSGAGFAFETMNQPYGISNKASSSNDVFRFYEAGTLPETAGASEWSVGLGANFIQGKSKTDDYAKLKFDFANGRIYFDNGTTATGTKYIRGYGADNFAFVNDVFPYTDNVNSCGTASRRWSVVYAGTGTINTSDERSKQQITSDLSPELKAWAKVEFCKYKLNDAVEKKGKDGARWHFGVIAQQVKTAFESEGLDPFAYGILCYDELDETLDDDGVIIAPNNNASNRYGIRYEEALILECAYLRSLLK